MNAAQLKKNVYSRVRLRPLPKRRDDLTGSWLQPVDDEWVIKEVTDAGVRLHNIATGHDFTLGADNIREYRSSISRTPGFLLLRCQLTLHGPAVLIEPTVGP